MTVDSEKREWTKYYRIAEGAAALHARFVGHRYPRHAHEHCVIGIVESGIQSYRYRGAHHVTPAGDLFVVNPDEPHTGEPVTADGYVYRTLCLRTDFLARELSEFCGAACFPYLKGAVLHDLAATQLLRGFHRLLAADAPELEHHVVLARALALLFTRYSDVPCAPPRIGREHKAVARARDYLEAHFDRSVSLRTLAEFVSLSPYYFARVFEHEAGLPPHRYLEGVRIRNACALLDRGETIACTATAVGYADQSHLTKRFRRFLGITPRQYLGNHGITHKQSPSD
ncbi:MAG TPA: AraC family transcriptional regulator [Steroidobacteraceae bacterium]|nr:AraC family transcriptional regulator [Steroidobacteraceae bacterium]